MFHKKQLKVRIKLSGDASTLKTLISNMTMLFSNSSPKLPKSGIFSPQCKNFQFGTNLCNKTNSRTLISNMAIVFSKFQAKNIQIRYFWSLIQVFSFFTKFCNQKNSRVLISNMIILFSNSSPIIPAHVLLFPNLRIFIFALNFPTRQIQGR